MLPLCLSRLLTNTGGSYGSTLTACAPTASIAGHIGQGFKPMAEEAVPESLSMSGRADVISLTCNRTAVHAIHYRHLLLGVTSTTVGMTASLDGVLKVKAAVLPLCMLLGYTRRTTGSVPPAGA